MPTCENPCMNSLKLVNTQFKSKGGVTVTTVANKILIDKVNELESRYGTMMAAPKEALAPLQEYANRVAPATRTRFEPGVRKQMANPDYQRQLMVTLQIMSEQDLTLVQMVSQLNQNRYFTMHGKYQFIEPSLAKLLKRNHIAFKKRPSGRRPGTKLVEERLV